MVFAPSLLTNAGPVLAQAARKQQSPSAAGEKPVLEQNLQLLWDPQLSTWVLDSNSWMTWRIFILARDTAGLLGPVWEDFNPSIPSWRPWQETMGPRRRSYDKSSRLSVQRLLLWQVLVDLMINGSHRAMSKAELFSDSEEREELHIFTGTTVLPTKSGELFSQLTAWASPSWFHLMLKWMRCLVYIFPAWYHLRVNNT